MEEFKINYKQLYKAYKKRLKKLHKTSSLSLDKSLELFVTRLKFVRDYFLLTESPVNTDGTENYKISTVATAIAEYEQYLASANNIEWLQKENNADTEASLQKYKIEQQLHWDCFCEIIRQNMSTWRIEDATI